MLCYESSMIRQYECAIAKVTALEYVCICFVPFCDALDKVQKVSLHIYFVRPRFHLKLPVPAYRWHSSQSRPGLGWLWYSVD